MCQFVTQLLLAEQQQHNACRQHCNGSYDDVKLGNIIQLRSVLVYSVVNGSRSQLSPPRKVFQVFAVSCFYSINLKRKFYAYCCYVYWIFQQYFLSLNIATELHFMSAPLKGPVGLPRLPKHLIVGRWPFPVVSGAALFSNDEVHIQH